MYKVQSYRNLKKNLIKLTIQQNVDVALLLNYMQASKKLSHEAIILEWNTLEVYIGFTYLQYTTHAYAYLKMEYLIDSRIQKFNSYFKNNKN